MFGMRTLDIVLGLVFVYVLLSLACTAVNELLAQWLNWRAETLRQGIRGLISNSPKPPRPAAASLLDRVRSFFSNDPRVTSSAPAPAAEAGPPPDLTVRIENARLAVDGAAERLKERVPRLFAAYAKAQAQLAAARDALAQKAGAEADVRKQLEKAEKNLAAALQSAVDGAVLSQLRSDVNNLRSELQSRLAETKAAVESLATAAGQEPDLLWNRLEKEAPEAARVFRTAERELDDVLGEDLVERFYQHPLICGLSQLRRAFNPVKQYRLPSYIPARVFSAALLDTIAPGAAPSSVTLAQIRGAADRLPRQLARPLALFIDGAGDDLDRFRFRLETWFEDSMQRVSGLYKRKTQVAVLLIALFVTLMSNADTLRIVRTLASDGVLRDALVAQAEALAANPGEDVKALLDADSIRRSQAGQPAAQLQSDSVARHRYRQARASVDSLQTLGVPLGWRGPCSAPARAARRTSCFNWKLPRESVLDRFAGLLLTVLAISLGAPFWFDVLNKVINIRSAGRAPEEKPKSPDVLPPATGAGR